MLNLVEGVHFFQNIGFQHHRQLFERLADGQKPEACFITCADSRIVPNLITNSQPGALFVVRNVGNLVPCHGTSNNGEMAAVDYSVTALGVRDIIVCGHTRCGAMQALVKPEACTLPSVTQWLRHAEATKAILDAHYSHLEGDALLNVAAQENVLVQLEHIRTMPVIAAHLARDQVNLHAWMYKIETGEMFRYDSDHKQFIPFAGGVPMTNGAPRTEGRVAQTAR